MKCRQGPRDLRSPKASGLGNRLMKWWQMWWNDNKYGEVRTNMMKWRQNDDDNALSKPRGRTLIAESTPFVCTRQTLAIVVNDNHEDNRDNHGDDDVEDNDIHALIELGKITTLLLAWSNFTIILQNTCALATTRWWQYSRSCSSSSTQIQTTVKVLQIH